MSDVGGGTQFQQELQETHAGNAGDVGCDVLLLQAGTRSQRRRTHARRIQGEKIRREKDEAPHLRAHDQIK